jgi:hypothetical protein
VALVKRSVRRRTAGRSGVIGDERSMPILQSLHFQ